MDSSTRPQTTATPPAPILSRMDGHASSSSEPSTRSSSPFQNLNVVSRSLPQSTHGNSFWTESLDIEYSPSVTPGSSPPYTRQGSVVDLEALKKEPYITVNSKPSHPLKEPYHVFSHGKKWSIVILIGVAGLFSGLSSNIYFPALDAIAKVSLAGSDPIYQSSFCFSDSVSRISMLAYKQCPLLSLRILSAKPFLLSYGALLLTPSGVVLYTWHPLVFILLPMLFCPLLLTMRCFWSFEAYKLSEVPQQ